MTPTGLTMTRAMIPMAKSRRPAKKPKKTKGTKHKADESGDGDDASTSVKPKTKHKSGKDGSSKHKKDHKTKDKKG